MPIASPSLVPYNQVAFTSTNGTAYKGNLDAMAAIASNPAGSFYVYPNSPAAMNVLVDTAFNYISAGSGISLNGGAGPQTVTITAPGSQLRYTTVFFDLTNGACGVVNGAIAPGPGPVLPNNIYQIPLACVLVATGATSITAANIRDVRQILTPRPLFAAQTNGGTIQCSGATSLHVDWTLTIAGQVLTLAGLQYGVTVSIFVTNVGGGTATCAFTASSPDGTNYASINCAASGQGGIGGFSSLKNGVGTLSLPTSTSRVFTGISSPSGLFFT